MLLPLSWLQELIPQLEQTLPQSELEPTFARMGLPLEGISEIPGIPQGVLFGTVTFCTPIPETHLFALEVDLGSESRSIVTGAPNSRAGVGVAVVPPGTTLNGVTLGVRQMQGLESWGMAASPAELGVGEYGGGLLLLPQGTAAPGTDLSTLWPADSVLDIEVTPNRADVLSALGVARDLAAFLKLELVPPSQGVQPEGKGNFPLELADEVLEKKGCTHFAFRRTTLAENGPAPLSIQRRLLLCGSRPRNLAVDVSNYVMLEIGQPNALYDGREVKGFVTTYARAGEEVVGLDGKTHTLGMDDLVIRNENGDVVSIAGILGAEFGSIQDSSTEILIEAARWNPVKLRLTARRAGLKTDAVYRFERGVDPLLPRWACNRLLELLGGDMDPLYSEVGEEYALEPKTIVLDNNYCRRLLGMDVSDAEMVNILERLGCEVTLENGQLEVKPPSWRVDMSIPEDLIEEIGRLHGFDELPETLPHFLEHPDNIGADSYTRHLSHVKNTLSGLGFSEVVNYSFTSQGEAENARAPKPTLELRNPLTFDRTHMRTALYPSLLNSARVNSAEPSLLLFELGRIFPESGELERLGVLMRGPLAPVGAQYARPLEGGFFTFKGLLESFAATLGGELKFQQFASGSAPAHLHPGISGVVLWNGFEKGVVGAVHPAIAQKWGLKGETYVLELNMPLLAQDWSFADPSRQPAALRDLAIIAPNWRSYGDLETLLKLEGGDLLEGVEVFDVYAGDPIPAGSRSVAVRLIYRSSERTLTDEEVSAEFNRLRDRVRENGLSIREG